MRIIKNYGPVIKAFIAVVDGKEWLVTQHFSLLVTRLPWIGRHYDAFKVLVWS